MKNSEDVTVGGVPFRGVRPGVLMAAAALTTAVGMTATSGCSTGDTSGPGAGSHGAATSGAAVNSVVTSTTRIAGAGVLGNQRRPDESCAAEPARLDPPRPENEPAPPVVHAAGQTAVNPDPQRIVVLAGDELDSLCALGLQGRIVGAALADGSDGQPSYLGTVVHDIAGIGPRDNPDLTAIRAAKPDLILGSEALTPQAYQALSEIAPTAFADAPGARWQDNLRVVGAATGRAEATGELIDKFTERAQQVSAAIDATHFQVSVVQFAGSTLRVYGANNFSGNVLSDVGVDRPAAQRFTDKPYLEIGISDTDLDNSADLSAADGDILYLSFASPEDKNRAPKVLESPAWRKLSATRDNRVFIVNNEVWQNGQGIVAARGILDDLRWLNAPIN